MAPAMIRSLNRSVHYLSRSADQRQTLLLADFKVTNGSALLTTRTELSFAAGMEIPSRKLHGRPRDDRLDWHDQFTDAVTRRVSGL